MLQIRLIIIIILRPISSLSGICAVGDHSFDETILRSHIQDVPKFIHTHGVILYPIKLPIRLRSTPHFLLLVTTQAPDH